MSEIKMSELFPQAFEVKHNKSFAVQNCHWVTFGEDFHSTCEQDNAIEHAVLNHDSLVEENSALTRERDFLAETIDQLSEHVGEAELQASGISIKYDSLVEEVERLRGERDELFNALSGIHKESVDYQARTGNPVTWCLKIGKLLAKIKGEDNE